MKLFSKEMPIKIENSIVELRQTHDGIFYIMINGHELQNTFTHDISLANKFYLRCIQSNEDNLISQTKDVIIKSNVETPN